MNMLRLLCLAAFLYPALACTGGRLQPPTKGDVFKRLVGKDVNRSPYTGSGDHPVASGPELSCNFDSGCCWANANSPTDQLDWEIISGQPEKTKLQSSFAAGSKSPPDGNYLGVGSETGGSGAETAQFYSCPIQCSDGPVTLSFRHWQTKDVELQVCQEDSPDGPLTDCQPVPKDSGTVHKATVPGGQNKRLVIVAKGFNAKGGSVALIDDITVEFQPCGSTMAEPTKSNTNACSKIACNFEAGNPCSYNTAQGAGGTKSFDVVKSPYQNPLTGIPKAADGQSLAGAYLKPGDTALMSTDVDYPENYVVKFFGYRATEGVDLSGCCGSPDNCPFSMSKQVQVSDYKNWQPATMTCPPGTKKVMFKGTNTGKNQGAVGLDNVQLLVPGGQGGQVPC